MGLLDTFFGTPEQTQALGLLGAHLMAGNAPAGFQAATQLMAEAPDRKLKRGLLEAQIAETLAQGDERKMKLKQADALQNTINSIFNAAPPSSVYGPGQLGSGSFDAVAPSLGQAAIPSPQPQGNRIGNASPDAIAMLSLMPGGKDLTPLWTKAKEGFERKPGSFYEDVNGRRQYVADPTKFINYDVATGTVSPMNGGLETSAALKGAEAYAQERAKAANTPLGLDFVDSGTKRPMGGSVADYLNRQPLQNMGGGQVTPELSRAIREDAARNGIPNPQVNLTGGGANATYGLNSAQTQRAPLGTLQSKAESAAAELEAKIPGETSLQFNKTASEKAADILHKGSDLAKTAADDLLGIQESRKALQDGIFAGSGAEFKLSLAKFVNANVPGVQIDPARVANTDYLKSTLGRGLLEQAKTLGSNPSNADANRINDIVGSIGKDPGALAKILDWRQTMALRSISQHNTRVDQAETNGYKAPFDLRVKNPLEQASADTAPAGAAPLTNAQGWTLHTDAKGNKAYVSPDGKKFQAVP